MPRVASVVPEETDLLCEGCGYTLKGLPSGSENCPECGKPIQESIGEHRVVPEWEASPGLPGFIRTSLRVMFRPTQFYRTLATRRDTEPARSFATVHWIICSMLFAIAAVGHLTWFSGLVRSTSGLWLAPMPLIALLTFAALLGTTWLAAKLTYWEATYRGIRLPLSVVLRGMYYHAAHYVPVAVLAAATVLGYRLLQLTGNTSPATVVEYLYVLSGEVILCAFYLFETYWIGMRNMMYANR
jgi:hypothetical protein